MTFRLGRNRPAHGRTKLHFHRYADKLKLPAPPLTCDYTTAASKALSEVYLNDRLGDCVIAGMAHVCGVLTANAGSTLIFSKQTILRLYEAIGGYKPGHPNTDNGCDEGAALDYWKDHGLLPDGSHKIAGWMSVNGADPVECRQALWLFENLYLGIELPDAWVNPMPDKSGFTWDVAGDPNPDNGHCIMAASYVPDSIGIGTWGMLGRLTNAALAKYATKAGSGELYCVLSQDAINKAKGRAPNGFDYSQLAADFGALGGDLGDMAV